MLLLLLLLLPLLLLVSLTSTASMSCSSIGKITTVPYRPTLTPLLLLLLLLLLLCCCCSALAAAIPLRYIASVAWQASVMTGSSPAAREVAAAQQTLTFRRAPEVQGQLSTTIRFGLLEHNRHPVQRHFCKKLRCHNVCIICHIG
jgi:steroid 5-alpha reductase family enzyme